MNESELSRYRDWHAEFATQKVRVSQKELDEDLGGHTITVCDGSKHRKLISGTCDLLVSIIPCNESCQGWQEKTGQDIREDVPNLSEKWFTSDEDVDNQKMVEALM